MTTHAPEVRRHRRLHLGPWLVGATVALVSAFFVGGAHSATPAPGLIAFTRYDGIYVMRSDGTGVRRIRRIGALGLAWSPDARRLAFTDGVRVLVVNADGSHLVRLARAPDLVHGDLASPTWSADGRRIAFTASSGEDRDVFVVNADGSKPHRLLRTPGLWEHELDWSPNGRRIAFIDIRGLIPRLYVMNADGGHLRALTPGMTLPGWFEAASPDWSPDGRTIAVWHPHGWSTEPEAGIFTVDPRNGSRHRLSAGSTDTHPNWSPDGRKIAFVRGGGEWANCLGCSLPRRNSGEIYVMNADGTGVTRLTHNRLGEGSPAWQPVVAP